MATIIPRCFACLWRELPINVFWLRSCVCELIPSAHYMVDVQLFLPRYLRNLRKRLGLTGWENEHVLPHYRAGFLSNYFIGSADHVFEYMESVSDSIDSVHLR